MGLAESRLSAWVYPEYDVRRDGMDKSTPLVEVTPRLNGIDGARSVGQAGCPTDKDWIIDDLGILSRLKSWLRPCSFRAFWSRELGYVIARTSLSSFSVEIVAERLKALVDYEEKSAAALGALEFDEVSFGVSNRCDLIMCFAVE